jgi:hypothetical protein
MEKPGEDGMTILKWILNKCYGWVWAEVLYNKIGNCGI